MSDLKSGPFPATAEPCLADDMLRGAEALAEFLLGDPTQRRKIYHLAETTDWPFFHMGAVLCGRKSKFLAYIEDQERKSLEEARKVTPKRVGAK